jgi:hemerythrin superfamily protein
MTDAAHRDYAAPRMREYEYDYSHRNQQGHQDRHYGNGGQSSKWLAPAAIGFAAGIAATFMRKAAVQSVSAVQGDWLEALKADHQIVDKAFEKLFQTSEKDVVQRTMIFGTIKGALTKHALEEENVIYPALRMHANEEEGKHLAADHGDIKTYLAELTMMEKAGPQFISRARDLAEIFRTHVREEEDDVFPAFRERLSKEENAKLTLLMHREGLKLA